MPAPSARSTTRVSRLVHAPRHAVYAALLDPIRIAQWLPPQGMRGIVHAFEPREGGRLHMSLVYEDSAAGPGGKTTEDTDTFQGRVVELRPEERVVWLVEFVSGQPGMSGEMRVAWLLEDAPEGTRVTSLCENIPPGIRPEDNEAGSASTLAQLARLLDRPAP